MGTVKKLTTEEVSTPIIENGTTIDAHVEHLRWSLNKTKLLLRGENPVMNWSESWRVRRIDPENWMLLIEQLRIEYDQLVQWLSLGVSLASDEQLKEVLALIPHAAYHLGAIRQMVLIIKG